MCVWNHCQRMAQIIHQMSRVNMKLVLHLNCFLLINIHIFNYLTFTSGSCSLQRSHQPRPQTEEQQEGAQWHPLWVHEWQRSERSLRSCCLFLSHPAWSRSRRFCPQTLLMASLRSWSQPVWLMGGTWSLVGWRLYSLWYVFTHLQLIFEVFICPFKPVPVGLFLFSCCQFAKDCWWSSE